MIGRGLEDLSERFGPTLCARWNSKGGSKSNEVSFESVELKKACISVPSLFSGILSRRMVSLRLLSSMSVSLLLRGGGEVERNTPVEGNQQGGTASPIVGREGEGDRTSAAGGFLTGEASPPRGQKARLRLSNGAPALASFVGPLMFRWVSLPGVRRWKRVSVVLAAL
ncbi:hypothetical protein NDU88_001211 [Pleurodeles waltl]|uniref:Uncharacterized protein n=1 Tax=Pleurodeles waltl TaxID=8319 RepID=A0AAV7WHP3_PLEWA|nr:hypothetical protein NDU88_001211 [Pleurodeles waltl]